MKTKSQRNQLIEQLKKTPIVQVTCEKTGISRATYYRWRKSSEKFRDEADQAIHAGTKLINDMAEYQLISAIKDQNLTAIIFWLKNHHKTYKTKVELSGKIKTINEILSPEQQNLIKQALKLTALYDDDSNNSEENNLPT